MPHLTIRVFWGNPMITKMLLRYAVECKCQVIFDQFYVYFIVTDDMVAILLQREVAIHQLASLEMAIEDLRVMLFTRVQSQTACTRVFMTLNEYNAIVSASSSHMTAFFIQHRPSCDEYAMYMRVCEFFGITPYTSWPVVNALWSIALTLQGAL